MKKILVAGSINIDNVYSVPHILRPGETLSSYDKKIYGGGKGANQAAAIGKAGALVWFFGKIGSGDTWLLEKLSSFGVQTDYTLDYDGPTGHTVIQVSDDGENSILLFGGGNKAIEEEDVDGVLSHFSKGDYMVLQNEINLMPYILRKASERGMKICLNPAPFEKSILNWPLELVDMFIVNELEGEELAGSVGDIELIIKILTEKFKGSEILLTAGGKGSYYGRGDERFFVPAKSVTPIDTTAAGDTYMGFFLSSRIAGYKVQECMERATTAASITVTRAGAMDSIPDIKEISF